MQSDVCVCVQIEVMDTSHEQPKFTFLRHAVSEMASYVTLSENDPPPGVHGEDADLSGGFLLWLEQHAEQCAAPSGRKAR